MMIMNKEKQLQALVLVDKLNEQVEEVLETLNEIRGLGIPLVHGGGPDPEDNHLFLDLKSIQSSQLDLDNILSNEDIVNQCSEDLRRCLQNNCQESAWCVLLDKSPLRSPVTFYVESYPPSETSADDI